MISSMTTISTLQPSTASTGLRVLVCEDVEDTRNLFVDLLRKRGYGVHAAASGGAAVEILQAGEIDVAIIDIGLPDISGLEVARVIRRAELPRYVRLIALTGYGTAADRAESQLVGFDAHLTKPIRMNELVQAISPPAR